MGLFDFVKDAGEKFFDNDDDAASPTETITVTPERLNEVRAGHISRSIGEAGIEIAGLDVSCDGEVASLRGTVATQAECEKATLCAGNQHGISSVDCQLEVTTPEPEAQFYTVKSGDSLSKIAKEVYGDPMKYKAIFEANTPMLADPDKIYPGQVLRIPAE